MSVKIELPEALIVDIFAKLPVKSLIRFMCLSKSYYQAISDPQFFHLHLRYSNQINKQFLLQISERPLTLQSWSFCHHQLLREPVALEPQVPLPSRSRWEMVGSCNGVLFLTTSPQPIRYLGILNPSIRKLKLVPFPNLEDSFYPPTCIYRLVDGTSVSTEIGFGFDSCTCDFKMPQVVVNGAFYWVVKLGINVCYSILMFDFTDETFKEIKMPDCFYEDQAYFYRFNGLGEAKGKLSLLLHSVVNSSAGISLEMWMMEDSGWVRQFVVSVKQLHAPRCLAMNDEVMLLLTRSDVGRILSCDLKTLKWTDRGVVQRPCAFAYTPSLALLGEEN
ncbi:hypothetical protein SLA2020_148970 [Shorea laevis]